MPEDRNAKFFEALVESTQPGDTAASTRLKSRIYSALIREMEVSGPLLDVTATEETHGLCVFEKVLDIAPMGERAARFNACSVCHARLLGERVENAPIYWKNCPYVGFQNR